MYVREKNSLGVKRMELQKAAVKNSKPWPGGIIYRRFFVTNNLIEGFMFPYFMRGFFFGALFATGVFILLVVLFIKSQGD